MFASYRNTLRFAKNLTRSSSRSAPRYIRHRLPRRLTLEGLECRQFLSADGLSAQATVEHLAESTGPRYLALSAPSVTAAPVSGTEAMLSWDRVSGATGYVVDEWVSGAWKQLGKVGGGTTSITIADLSPKTTYYFDVGAYNSVGTTWAHYSTATTDSSTVTVQEPAAGAAYTPVSGTLFGANGPVFTDVHQGNEGDCWLLASFAAVAAREPQDIVNMFSYEGTTVLNGAAVALYSVRFFDSAGVAEHVTVDTELPDGGQYYDQVQNGVLWVALAEKAYAEANGAGIVTTGAPGSDSYDALNGGWGDWALQAITGKSVREDINPSDIAAAWNAGEPIVLGSSPYAATNDDGIVGFFDSQGQAETHAYAIVNYNALSQFPFELYNPWGQSGKVECTDQGQEVWGGAFDANAFCLLRDFADQSIGAGAQPMPPERHTAGATPVTVTDETECLLRDLAATTTPANSAHDSVFAESSWMVTLHMAS